MGIISRGVKNAFRNTIRTVAISAILGISIALALVMLLSLKAVEAKISSVKSSIGNSIAVSPAGARGFEGGGEPLTTADVNQITTLPHIVKVNETLSDRLTPTTDTNLASPINPGTLGNRAGRGFGRNFGGNGGNFQVPIRVIGTSDPGSAASFGGGSLTLQSGSLFDPSKDVAEALVGKDLATKNNLTVGSTFQAYSTTVKVDGIFDAGSNFANDAVVLPLKTLQRLSGQNDQINQATVQVDSIDNLKTSVAAIKTKLGTKADVVSAQDTSNQALQPLENVRSITLYSLFGTIGAGAVIIFLAMLMIVRERRREIGILKAIGSGNFGIVAQFVTEAATLTSVGVVLGFALGIFLSNPILGVLLNNSTSQAASGGSGQGGFRFTQFAANTAVNLRGIRNITTSADLQTIIYGIGIAFLIAIVGSVLPAWFISKVRPAEVLRNE